MTQDFFDLLPAVSSVRARLAEYAARTEAGELNTLLNDAYEYITHLEATK